MRKWRKFKNFLLGQFVFYFKIRPNIKQSVIKTYKEHKKKLRNTYALTNDYFNQYMPLQYDINNPFYQNRLCINHYRLWNFIGDYFLYFEKNLTIAYLKEKYFNYFKLDTIRNNCFLCFLDKTKYSDCEFCKNIWNNLFKCSKCYPCGNSYYGMFAKYDLTINQKVLICFMIAELVVPLIETQFYKDHLLADCSEEKVNESWSKFNIDKLHGIFETEFLYKDLFKEKQ